MKSVTNPLSLPAVRCLGALIMLLGAGAAHADRCANLVQAFGNRLADVSCVDSTDLTTANPATTPANNSLPGLPPFAFTPQSDRATIAPDPANRTPIKGPVPGLQLNARIASDPTGQARFLLRLPANWNGRLVVAGASGTRSEFNGDFAWSDYVVQKGYAYASQNKGVLNLKLSDGSDPLACRLNPTSPTWAHFYDNDPGQEFTRWRDFMVLASKLAHQGAAAHYGRAPRYTYAVGTSNGGYQVRRAVESAPEWFAGGVDWEGTFVDANAANLLTDLPAAVLNFPDYVDGGMDATSLAARNIRAAGFPPDLGSGATSLWSMNSASFWEVTLCQWQKRLDPAYDTYGSGPENYNYSARQSVSEVGDNVADFSTSGRLQRPLITVAGTMDALLPIDHHARAYARKVAAAGRQEADGDEHRHRHHPERQPAYRLYEVQNGNHIETYKLTLPQLELIQPHAQRAFDLLVGHVEQGRALPPDQCIGRGQSIGAVPAQPGHCAELLVP
ncbi:3-hydroxybutyrate oligomer hydrolase family protein [Azonexus sp. IMCC34842]|uniref:3-hydroxybutyrate oligomer hydrolase family protein n=1 Tax=Azonexus sp. IMCC34842 TaxID=3420950 RepID=UPI003D09C674